MATSSFDKHFVIRDSAVAEKLHKSLKNPNTIKVRNRNLDNETKKGISGSFRNFV